MPLGKIHISRVAGTRHVLTICGLDGYREDDGSVDCDRPLGGTFEIVRDRFDPREAAKATCNKCRKGYNP